MGKPKHSNDQRGEQKGAQDHAEGQYGPKAFEAKFAEISDHSRRDEQRAERDQSDPNRRGQDAGGAELHERMIAAPELENDGRHRLFENRKQHDEAEKNSEKNRTDIDMRRHGHDPAEFQGRGGHTGHPELPEGDPANIKAGGQGGSNRKGSNGHGSKG